MLKRGLLPHFRDITSKTYGGMFFILKFNWYLLKRISLSISLYSTVLIVLFGSTILHMSSTSAMYVFRYEEAEFKMISPSCSGLRIGKSNNFTSISCTVECQNSSKLVTEFAVIIFRSLSSDWMTSKITTWLQSCAICYSSYQLRGQRLWASSKHKMYGVVFFSSLSSVIKDSVFCNLPFPILFFFLMLLSFSSEDWD